MRAERKAARDRCMAIKTKADFEAYMDTLNLSDEDRHIAYLMFCECWTRTKIALEMGYSEKQLKRRIARIYDRMV